MISTRTLKENLMNWHTKLIKIASMLRITSVILPKTLKDIFKALFKNEDEVRNFENLFVFSLVYLVCI